MTRENPDLGRRNVLKTVGGGVAGLGVAGKAGATRVNTTQFAEIGIEHQLDHSGTALSKVKVYEPKGHQVVSQDGVLRIQPELLSDSDKERFKNEGSVIWANDYYTPPSNIVKQEPLELAINELDSGYQPVTAVNIVGRYKSPRIDVTTNDGELVLQSLNQDVEVSPGEERELSLQERSIVVRTVNNDNLSIRSQPVIKARNYGELQLHY